MALSRVVIEQDDEVFGGYPWFYNNNNYNNYNSARLEGFPWARNYKQRLNLLSDEVLASINPDRYLEQRFQEAMSSQLLAYFIQVNF